MTKLLPILAIASLLAACSGEHAPADTPKSSAPAETASQPVAEKQAEPAAVRAPVPPPPPGGGMKAPEIPAEQLEKIRAELEAKMKEAQDKPAK